MINTVLNKYSDLKTGKPIQKNEVDRKESPVAEPKGTINLIDFDDMLTTSAGPSHLNELNPIISGQFQPPVQQQFQQSVPSYPQASNNLLGVDFRGNQFAPLAPFQNPTHPQAGHGYQNQPIIGHQAKVMTQQAVTNTGFSSTLKPALSKPLDPFNGLFSSPQQLPVIAPATVQKPAHDLLFGQPGQQTSTFINKGLGIPSLPMMVKEVSLLD